MIAIVRDDCVCKDNQIKGLMYKDIYRVTLQRVENINPTTRAPETMTIKEVQCPDCHMYGVIRAEA